MALVTDLMNWRTPTFQDFETADIPEELFRSPLALSQAQPRRRLYTETEWNTIRPVFTHLYIDQDRTLRDVITHLKTHHDFHPTEQMCKKRIPVWGLSKNTRAKDKEVALEEIAQGYTCQRIPHHKLIRYSKSQSKHKQALNGIRPKSCTKMNPRGTDGSHPPVGTFWRTIPNVRTATLITPKVTRSLALPTEDDDIDLLLRATQRMVLTTEAKEMDDRSSYFNEITTLLADGAALWSACALAQAGSAFSRAADIISENMRRGAALDARFIHYLTPGWWSSSNQSLLQALVGFVVRSTSEHLGSEHPWTVLAQHLQKTHSHHVRLRMWNCILDNVDVLIEGTASWWDLVRARFRCYQDADMHELALKYCHEAADVARKSNRFTEKMELRFLYDLGLIYFEMRRDHEAQSVFERFLEVAQVDIAMNWCNMSLVLEWLAKLHEDRGEVDQARQRYEQCLEFSLNSSGIEDAVTVKAFVSLLRFCQNHDLQDELTRLKQQYADFYNHVEEITEGLWNLDLEDGSGEAEELS
ncbi:hypothetical protein LTR70_004687 [Exophiala xenobiotica]|uniref:Clr5 domain-containing protein n=1 Tax=Lithohypha guttulata TaxID=1690604 RepID=A0ABR0KDJ6_9EURO|nr:hypothetical protein LTR24_004192 [Lithohypha guttulata]KAK5320324.1 hypothetical protein LTR70_004687 [Exophiala xenobiotica]